MARHPKLTTKSGMPNGMTTRTAKSRRHGRSVRSTNQAAEVPRTAHSAVTTTSSDTVFQISVAVRPRKSSAVQLGPTDLDRLDDQERQREQHDQGDEDGDGRQQQRQGPPPGVGAGEPPPSRAHKSLRLLEQPDRFGARAQLGDGDVVGLQLVERGLRLRGA